MKKKWTVTFNLRRQYLNEKHSLAEILEEWPIYKQSFGYKLISSDFSKIFPGKDNMLLEKWETFSISMTTLFQNQLQNNQNLNLLKNMNHESGK